jgi:hypothetical protein
MVSYWVIKYHYSKKFMKLLGYPLQRLEGKLASALRALKNAEGAEESSYKQNLLRLLANRW